MATDVGIPASFQYKFLRNDVTNGDGLLMPLTPPVTERRRQSIDSPLSRPRPRTVVTQVNTRDCLRLF